MGCACLRSKRLEFLETNALADSRSPKKNLNKTNIIKINKANITKINYINKLSKNLWLRVLDFLAFKDLSQTGKTNRLFNSLSKSFQILTKFFKNKTLRLFSSLNKNGNMTTNINNNIIYINPTQLLSSSSLSSIPSFQKSSFLHSSRMYFSSNNNSSSNGTIGSLQKTLNTLKYLKNQTNKNSFNNANNNPNNNRVTNHHNNFNSMNTINYYNNVNNKLSSNNLNYSNSNNNLYNNMNNTNTVIGGFNNKNIYSGSDNLTELDNFLFNKLLESNPALYKDIFNRSDLDFSRIMFENSRNSSVNKTPTFSSHGYSEAQNISANNTYLFGNGDKPAMNGFNNNVNNNNSFLEQTGATSNHKRNFSGNAYTQMNTNNYTRFFTNTQDLNIIYEDNKFENHDRDDLNLVEE